MELSFFQLPQVLLYGEKYKELSDSAKLGYVVLRDRLEYSLQNNWIDDENRVYFIFTNHELQNLFGWSNTKVAKIKKELETAELLFQIKQGFDPKKKKNLPNRLYLADLEVTAKDVYIKRDFANKTAETLDTSGHHEIGRRQEMAETLDTSGHHEIGLIKRLKPLIQADITKSDADKKWLKPLIQADITKSDTIYIRLT